MGLFSAEEAKPYQIDDKQLVCTFCDNDTFYTRREQLSSPTRSFFNVEWTDSTAMCFICSSCGFMHWFMR